jgi:hypothetical protein
MVKSTKMPYWATMAVMFVVIVAAGIVVYYITNPQEEKKIGFPSK